MIRRRVRLVQVAAILFIGTVVLAGIPALAPPAHAAGELSQYTIPIEVKNLGGSDAGPCSVSLALDGQRLAVHTLTQGISAGDSVRISFTVMASPGSHQLLAFVDEAGQVTDSNRSNNQAQGRYVFP